MLRELGHSVIVAAIPFAVLAVGLKPAAPATAAAPTVSAPPPAPAPQMALTTVRRKSG